MFFIRAEEVFRIRVNSDDYVDKLDRLLNVEGLRHRNSQRDTTDLV